MVALPAPAGGELGTLLFTHNVMFVLCCNVLFCNYRVAVLLLLQVKGKRLDTEGGIRTRARAAAQAEQWSAVPVRVKILMLLTDAYIESTTQGGWVGAWWLGWAPTRVAACGCQLLLLCW